MSDSEKAKVKDGNLPAMNVGGTRIPLSNHHEEVSEEFEKSEELEESEDNERCKTVVISGARVKGKVFSPKASTSLGKKAELDVGLPVKVGGKKLPKHHKGKAEAAIFAEESEEEERPKTVVISGARVEGKEVFSPKTPIFLGREVGVDAIETLCREFSAGHLEKEMMETFMLLKERTNLTAVAAAVFILVYRRKCQPISIKQVLPVLNVSPPVTLYKLGAILKKVERHLKGNFPALPQPSLESTRTSEAGSSSSIPVVFHHARSVLPKLKVQDPFLPSVEISERVYNITDNIVAVFERRTKQSFDRRIITIAAGFLAWQSCHYYDKNFNSKVPFKELIEPNKTGYFQKYLTLTYLDIGDVTAKHIKRSVLQISKELLPLFQHMTWIEKEGKGTDDIPKYLGRILQFKDVAIEALFQEEETARINEPITAPVIPRELTAEEEAILDAPDLNENDLPDAELSKYFFSERELNPLNVNLSLSADLDSELAEPNKKGKKKRSKSKPTV
ncbi:uncharacterized protein LOC124193660 [Daphnia pulex]|uniref:uncharacterized protein LOC124193660 n=1 Tax=Daphnia pulex TaxID=6669 RepID=UPI001EDF5DCE|nr:uncharacterized protein LOC124193660 [Daphnia pulex]